MTDPYFEMLINQYKEYAEFLKEFRPILVKDRDTLVSWSNYTRIFCLALIAHVDPGKKEHRAFVNNLILSGLPELSSSEYQDIFQQNRIEDFDNDLYGSHLVTQKLIDYDAEQGTAYFQKFISRYCTIAEIFSDQSASLRSRVEDFVSDYKECAKTYISSGGGSWGKSSVRTISRKPISNANSTSNQIFESTGNKPEKVSGSVVDNRTFSAHGKMHPHVDGQFWLRIIIPFVAGCVLVILGITFKSIGFFVGAVVAFVIFGFGVKANTRRCPRCKAWNSLVTVKSEQVGQKKVKVRRNLNSTYYRTSGNATFGSRQVFVNADEYTYKEQYRCSNCGYEMMGTRSKIDDGIRWG